MIKKIEQGYDIVYGKRIFRKGESKFKKISAYLYYRILNLLSDHKIPTDSGDFRLINKKALNAFLKFSENEKYIRGLFSFIGFKQTFVEYQRDERFSGETVNFLAWLAVAWRSECYRPVRPMRQN